MPDRYNAPAFPLHLRILRFPAVATILGVSLYLSGIEPAKSASMAILATLSLLFFLVFRRTTKFVFFLKGIGVKTKLRGLSEDSSITGVIPFADKGAVLSAQVSNEGIIAYRLGIARYIDWNDVLFTKKTSFLGQPILELGLTQDSPYNRFFVPWSTKKDEYLPIRFDS